MAQLEASTQLLSKPSILLNILPLLEAKGSSEIENIITTTDKLFKGAALFHKDIDAATKEALSYKTALHSGYKSIEATQTFDSQLAIHICSIVQGQPMHIRSKEPVFLTNSRSGEKIYTPPTGQDLITKKLTNLFDFLNQQTEFDPLVRMAVAHYQFEAIHPFHDGNGRTGRILNILFLSHQNLLSLPILYLSRHINNNRLGYYELIKNVTEEKLWEPWILFMLNAVCETATWTNEKVIRIGELMLEMKNKIQTNAPQIYSDALLETLFEQPYCRIANLVDNEIAKRQTASVYLKQLCDLGILKEFKVWREKLYVNLDLMRLF